jgi:hypothetical protein
VQHEQEEPTGETIGMLCQIGFDSTWVQRKRQDAIVGEMMRHPVCENDISLSTLISVGPNGEWGIVQLWIGHTWSSLGKSL